MLVANLKAKLLKEFILRNQISEIIDLADVEFVDTTMDLRASTNSATTLRCLPSCPNFKGSKRLYYNRYSIAVMLKGMRIPGKASDYPRVWDLIDTLNEVYGLPLYREDFADIPIRPDVNAFDFRPRTTSVTFIPLTNIVLEFME